jgi:hypothetical protein
MYNKLKNNLQQAKNQIEKVQNIEIGKKNLDVVNNIQNVK